MMTATSTSAVIAALCLCASSASANLVANGGFESTTLVAPGFAAGTLASWTVAGLDYIWLPGTADTPSNISALWGPGTGAANGLPATSPSGGNFLEQDPYYNTPLSQAITLVAGSHYKLDFDWAAATWTGAQLASTTRDWQVTLGSLVYTTPVVTLGAKGFQGWFHASTIFTPTASGAQLLSFLSQGSGDPPVALLDGVSLVEMRDQGVPEPAAWSLMVIGLGALGVAARRRRTAGVRQMGLALQHPLHPDGDPL